MGMTAMPWFCGGIRLRTKCILIHDIALILPKPTLISSFRLWNRAVLEINKTFHQILNGLRTTDISLTWTFVAADWRTSEMTAIIKNILFIAAVRLEEDFCCPHHDYTDEYVICLSAYAWTVGCMNRCTLYTRLLIQIRVNSWMRFQLMRHCRLSILRQIRM